MARAAAAAKTAKTATQAAAPAKRATKPAAAKAGAAPAAEAKAAAPKASRAAPAPAKAVKPAPARSTKAAAPAPAAPAKKAKAAPAPAASGKRKPKVPALKAITLRQFAATFAEEKGMKRADSVALLEEIIGKIRTHIANGTKVRLQGLGNFEIRDRPARMGRNPATGEAIKIAASRKLVFKPAAELKEAV